MRHLNSDSLFSSARIIGGVTAIAGELPWQVLFDKDNECGGTLVSLQVFILPNRYVLRFFRNFSNNVN